MCARSERNIIASFILSWATQTLLAASQMSAYRYSGTKIVAIGKNYAAHAVEMGGSAARRASPLFFLKPSSSVVQAGGAGGSRRATVVLPRGIGEVHHEVELGVVIGARARHVRAADALAHVRGYCLALDMTARDLQAAAKAAGAPWTHGKCFDTFTPLASAPLLDGGRADPRALSLWLRVDGAERQRGRTADMLHSVPELLAYVSTVMTLEPGDVLLTGTPSGVGPVRAGQVIHAGIDDAHGATLAEEEFDVVDETAAAQ
jgi:acylpyruvate hydrolase